MAGGPEAALQAGTAEIEALDLPLADGAVVVDLGAGFGMHCVSHYPKAAAVTGAPDGYLRASGFSVRSEAGLRGMVRLVAQSV